ncbi:hypothetical protein ACVIGA_004236 [Bradyrhizobium sp. USDA 3240]
MSATILTEDLAARFARIALGHVTREYPNKPDHVLAGPQDAHTPRELHPVFFGSYDWHSCVHSYWMLARLLRRYPASEAASEIRALFDTQFVAEKVAVECAYLAAPTARGFKRPYGWGWLLKLAAELAVLDERGGASKSRRLPESSRSAFATSCRSPPIRCGSARISTPRSGFAWPPTTPQ